MEITLLEDGSIILSLSEALFFKEVNGRKLPHFYNEQTGQNAERISIKLEPFEAVELIEISKMWAMNPQYLPSICERFKYQSDDKGNITKNFYHQKANFFISINPGYITFIITRFEDKKKALFSFNDPAYGLYFSKLLERLFNLSVERRSIAMEKRLQEKIAQQKNNNQNQQNMNNNNALNHTNLPFIG